MARLQSLISTKEESPFVISMITVVFSGSFEKSKTKGTVSTPADLLKLILDSLSLVMGSQEAGTTNTLLRSILRPRHDFALSYHFLLSA